MKNSINEQIDKLLDQKNSFIRINLVMVKTKSYFDKLDSINSSIKELKKK